MSRLLIALLAVSGIAHAECYMRSATVSNPTGKIEQIADQEQAILPMSGGRQLCRVTFRALINGSWEDAEGESEGPESANPAQICAQALTMGRTSILKRVSNLNMESRQDMVCTDQPKPVTRAKVNVGDIVAESEVTVHPQHPTPFKYHGNECRWFTEMDLVQGIICRNPSETAWRVVDKW